MLKVNDVEPNASRAVMILLHGGKIAVKFTSQQLYVRRKGDSISIIGFAVLNKSKNQSLLLERTTEGPDL